MKIKLEIGKLEKIRDINPRVLSYNVEMTEVTGGTFWKAYTPEQIAGTEPFKASLKGFTDMSALMQWYEPVDLYSEKLRTLAKGLGESWVRVSGTWATKTYYDFDNTGAPEGFQNVLKKEQWIGVLDFVKAINAKLLISVANCDGLHAHDEPWNPSEVEKIFNLTKEYGAKIDAVEFVNEPNIIAYTGLPKGTTAADFARDHDIFVKWVKEHSPETLIVGLSSVGEGMESVLAGGAGGQMPAGMNFASTDQLLEGTTEKLDVFSYHYYNGISARGGGSWPAEAATTEMYLGVAPAACKAYIPVRDRHVPGGEMWVTESGDAGCGGNTWASTFLDVFRTANELGTFAQLTNGVIFHNTLASSDYGFVAHTTFNPRPNYWLAHIYTQLMGTTVYDTKEEIREGAHVFAHNRKDGKEGVCYMIVNNSLTETTTVELEKEAEVYVLSADSIRAPKMKLNGVELNLDENNQLPKLNSVKVESGSFDLAPATITFIVL